MLHLLKNTIENFVFSFKFSRKNKILVTKKSNIRRSKIGNCGTKNYIEIENSNLVGVSISFVGSGNKLIIRGGGQFNGCNFAFRGDNNQIVIDSDCLIEHGCELFVSGGKTINIGKNTLIAKNCSIFTSDLHFIYLKGKQINLEKNIYIGEHCWICQNCTILKGTIIPDNNIVASNSLVLKNFSLENTLIGGLPAKVLKTNIEWSRYNKK